METKKFDFNNSILCLSLILLIAAVINAFIFYFVYILFPSSYSVFFLLLIYYYLCTRSPGCLNSILGGLVFLLTAYLGIIALVEPIASLIILVPTTFFLWSIFCKKIERYLKIKELQLQAIKWVKPWAQSILDDENYSFRLYLEKAILPSHPLWGKAPKVIGYQKAKGELAVILKDGSFAIVHYDWSLASSGFSAEIPRSQFFSSISELLYKLNNDAQLCK
jgi:hypothetical protein